MSVIRLTLDPEHQTVKKQDITDIKILSVSMSLVDQIISIVFDEGYIDDLGNFITVNRRQQLDIEGTDFVDAYVSDAAYYDDLFSRIYDLYQKQSGKTGTPVE